MLQMYQTRTNQQLQVQTQHKQFQMKTQVGTAAGAAQA